MIDLQVTWVFVICFLWLSIGYIAFARIAKYITKDRENASDAFSTREGYTPFTAVDLTDIRNDLIVFVMCVIGGPMMFYFVHIAIKDYYKMACAYDVGEWFGESHCRGTPPEPVGVDMVYIENFDLYGDKKVVMENGQT